MLSDERVAALAALLVSRRTGILPSLTEIAAYADDPLLWQVTVQPGDWGRLPGGSSGAPTCGRGARLGGAFAGALFETVERYCAAFVDEERLVIGRPEGDEYLFGERLPIYTEAQHQSAGWPFVPLGERSHIGWIAGRALASGRRRYLPALRVHLGYAPRSPEEQIGYATSNGLACADSEAAACLAGLYEVCERDAFAIMWLNRLSMPRLIPKEGSALATAAQAAAGERGEVVFVDLTNDLEVPVVLALLRRPLGARQLVTIGTSAHSCPTTAAHKALCEAVGGYTRLRDADAEGLRFVAAPQFANVTDFRHHGLLYADERLHRFLDFITASPHAAILEERPPESLSALAGRLDARGIEIVATSLTTRDVAELGLHVVRVVVPAAVPVSPDHRYPEIAHPRLRSVPRALGYATDGASLQLDVPHPFC